MLPACARLTHHTLPAKSMMAGWRYVWRKVEKILFYLAVILSYPFPLWWRVRSIWRRVEKNLFELGLNRRWYLLEINQPPATVTGGSYQSEDRYHGNGKHH